MRLKQEAEILRWLSLNTPMGPEIDGELKREMSLQMLENRTYLRFHSSKSEGHPAGGATRSRLCRVGSSIGGSVMMT